jgi:hypothetical protein
MREYSALPARARAVFHADRRGLPEKDPGCDRVIEEGLRWLGLAQDCSATRDGGVARHYSLITGWAASYPETTGYIIPTFLEFARITGDLGLESRARRMLDWLVSIQLPDGGFQGGLVTDEPKVPVTFNTGQILLGLAAGTAVYGDDYRAAMNGAADWLVKSQDPDGCWRKYPTRFTWPGEKAYETHVAWGLFEAARVQPDRDYARAALANVRWALTRQTSNGWFDGCCLRDPVRPLTHTLGYALRGVIEAYRFTREQWLLDAAVRTADGLLSAIRLSDGYLPGRLDRNWAGAVTWVCLTGSVQIAQSWFMLYEYTGNERYLRAALAANRYVRRTVFIDGPDETRGAVKGPFPVNGHYGPYLYLNWACKFLVDACHTERRIASAIPAVL